MMTIKHDLGDNESPHTEGSESHKYLSVSSGAAYGACFYPADTCEIPLTQGMVAIVDAAIYEYLSQWKWHAVKAGRTFYAVRQSPGTDGKPKKIYMHRLILNVAATARVDHIDHGGLHNWNANLRLATHAQNASNHRRYANNTSGFAGVGRHRSTGKWQARLKVNRKLIHLGYFDSRFAAAMARDKAARKHHGDFASPNSPVTFSAQKKVSLAGHGE